MVDIPDIDRTTVLIVVNVLGFVGAVTFIGAMYTGVVTPSLPLYVGVGAVWVGVLMAALFLLNDDR